jgi:2-deoxy-D-gluconate 3-dehydrogenase
MTDRVAIVTGGLRGLGRGMTLGLAASGVRVLAVGHLPEDVAAMQGKPNVRPMVADLRSPAACDLVVAEALAAFGRLDILVNNAGTSVRKMPQDYTEDEWHHVLDTNLTSAFLCSQAAYPAMLRAGGGKMINVGSMMSLFGAPYATPYAASKGGIVQMSRAMATAWAKDNIQVNAVLPGWIDTDLTKRARQQVQGLHDSVEKRTPHGRWGTPADMAGIAAFLAGPASDFVTGTAIPVDGGFSIGM